MVAIDTVPPFDDAVDVDAFPPDSLLLLLKSMDVSPLSLSLLSSRMFLVRASLSLSGRTRTSTRIADGASDDVDDMTVGWLLAAAAG